MINGKSSLIRYFKTGIRDISGDGYIDLIVKFMVSMCLIYCFMAIAPVFIKKQSLDYMAESLARTIEITGSRGDTYKSELNRLKSETGLNPSVVITGSFNNDKIQVRERFNLRLTDYVSIKLIDPAFASPVEIRIPVSKSITGMSEVYWKPEIGGV